MLKVNNYNLKEIVRDNIKKYGPNADLNHLDTSEITDMSELFFGMDFNGDISKWDVSHVKNMYCMFFNNKIFNQDISKWDVHNVINMSRMFVGCDFNQDISEWDIHNVENMSFMFNGSKFNQDLSKWKINDEVDIHQMLWEDNYYNQEITWDVDLKKIFFLSYNDYMERRKLKVLGDLCVL